MKNKLSYLGFLGLLGFTGFFGSFLLFGFFGFFEFFKYIKVEPDELFWSNVRTCATRSFFIFLVTSSILLVAVVLLTSNNLYTYALALVTGGFGVIVAICTFVFAANLAYLERKEKSVKDDGD